MHETTIYDHTKDPNWLATAVTNRAKVEPWGLRSTRQDAFAGLIQARMGSLATPHTPTYLAALREGVYKWLDNIDAAIIKALRAQQAEAEKSNLG